MSSLGSDSAAAAPPARAEPVGSVPPEEALREREEHLRLALQASGSFSFEWDIVGDRARRLNVAGQSLDAWGVMGGALEGYTARLHPDDRARFRAALAAALAPGRGHYRSEHRVLEADGRIRWLAEEGRVYFDAEGRPLRLLGVARDVTERQEANERLRASEARQSFLLRLNDRLGRLNDAEQIQYEAACALGEFLGVERVGYAEDLGDGEHVAVRRNYVRDVPDLAGIYRYVDYGTELLAALRAGCTVVRPDIENDRMLSAAEKAAHASLQIGASVNVPLLRDDALVAILFVLSRAPRAWREDEVALCEAVAERTASAVRRGIAEAALRESEQRFRSMADQTPIILWVHDVDGGLEFVNAEYCRFFGVTFEQVLGPGWQPLIHPDDSAAYVEAFETALRNRTPFDAAARVRRADGQWRWVESHGLPRFGPAGDFLGMIGVSPDMTEQRRASEQEREAARQKDHFIAVLAHELRNPLAPIRNAVTLLKRRGPPDPDLMRWRDVIDRQVAQMARLLDDLLDVARLSQGKLTLQRAPLRLADVIDAAVETARPHVDERGHTLVVQPVDPALALLGDKARLTQVLANLLNNAAKYTDRGGRIDVAVECRDGVARIAVRDNGRGIDPAVGERVFELFAQGDDAPQRGEGLGIGLALARRLVEMHGGTITAASAGRGQGTTFTVTLPLAVASAPAPAVAGEANLCSVRWRVLVADDNVDAADTMAMLLQGSGCEVRTVYDGESALREARAFRPELMLLDLGMPALSGQEVCRRIRGETWGADVVVAAVTGWAQEGDRRRTQVAGFDHHLVKPVDPAALLELVAGLGNVTLR